MTNDLKYLFEAMNKGYFELAKHLVPEGRVLCGYARYDEPHVQEEYGVGWAGQFRKVEVPAGIYPVVFDEYFYNERAQMYTNEVRDFPGVSILLAGRCIANSSYSIDPSEPNEDVICPRSYGHAMAHAILEGSSNVTLFDSFEAAEVPFIAYDGNRHVTYGIFDRSLPELVEENPKTTPRFIFDDDLCIQDDSLECIDGYLWATDDLVSRLMRQEAKTVPLDVLNTAMTDSINFYAFRNLKDNNIELEGTYWIQQNGTEQQRQFSLPLSAREKDKLRYCMEKYCQKWNGMSCLDFANKLRAEEGKEPIGGKIPLSSKIQVAEQKNARQENEGQSVSEPTR